MSRFDDRLDPARYENDPMFGVGLGNETPGDDAVWVPERIIDRLVAVGRAYELHFVPMIADAAAVYLNAVQAAGLSEELEFIMGLVDDPLLVEQAQRIAPLVSRGVRQDVGVTFEVP